MAPLNDPIGGYNCTLFAQFILHDCAENLVQWFKFNVHKIYLNRGDGEVMDNEGCLYMVYFSDGWLRFQWQFSAYR